MLSALPKRGDYDARFREERQREYPAVNAFERRCGYAVDRARLERAARVLACPYKVNPPNWQHGRVLYAAARRLLSRWTSRVPWFVDVGTAKGFSACVMAWALADAQRAGSVLSLDVVDPAARVRRNSVAEVGKMLLTVSEFAAPFLPLDPDVHVRFRERGAEGPWPGRVELGFVDGKHTYDWVRRDAAELSARQGSGDVIVFDDVQVPGVWAAVAELADVAGTYSLDVLWAVPERRGYAVATRL